MDGRGGVYLRGVFSPITKRRIRITIEPMFFAPPLAKNIAAMSFSAKEGHVVAFFPIFGLVQRRLVFSTQRWFAAAGRVGSFDSDAVLPFIFYILGNVESGSSVDGRVW